MAEDRSDRFRYQFYSIPEIIEHIRGRYKHMVWIGKDYSVADLIRDLEEIEREREFEKIEETEREETGWWGLVGDRDETT